MKRILVIDGAYFAHRTLGAINMGDKVNHLETPNEQVAFKAALNASLVNLWEVMSNHADSMILVNDSRETNWRKLTTPHIPYYFRKKDENNVEQLVEGTPVGYKEQRVDKKKDSDINYDNFYKVANEFADDMATKIPVMESSLLEGDDLILLLSSKFQEIREFQGIVFCTDGDLVQTVNANNILFRNIRSKVAPEGEFVMTQRIYEDIFEGDVESKLLGSTVENNVYKQLFGCSLKGTRSVARSINAGVTIAKPFKTALIKSICGDKKDNIFSIISWFKGDKRYSLTEKMIEKALKQSGKFLTESTCKDILTNKEALLNLLRTLIKLKDAKVDLADVGKHLKHNLKMIILSKNNLPTESIEDFNRQWEGYLPQIKQKLTLEDLTKGVNQNVKDSATDVLENSIPDGLI